MSEYQYYEFRAIDRPLSEQEMDELGKLSPRAEVTPIHFANTYQYGNFKGSPETLMERYFDAFVCIANWGTRRLMFRIPEHFLNVEAVSAYCWEHGLERDPKKECGVLKFSLKEEGGWEWTEGEPWMPSLIAIRAELMCGDLRVLYLGWLSSLGFADYQQDKDDAEHIEPSVLPGLTRLSGALQSLSGFLRIDDDLLEVAAAA